MKSHGRTIIIRTECLHARQLLELAEAFPDYHFFTLANGSKLDFDELRKAIAQRVKPWSGPQLGMTLEMQRQQAAEYQKASGIECQPHDRTLCEPMALRIPDLDHVHLKQD